MYISCHLSSTSGNRVLRASLPLASLFLLASTGAAGRGDLDGNKSRSADTPLEADIANFLNEVHGNSPNESQGNRTHISTRGAANARPNHRASAGRSTRSRPIVSHGLSAGTSARQGRSGQEVLGNVQIVEKMQLQKSRDNLDKVMADAGKDIAKSLSKLYEVTSQHLQGEAQKMFDVAKLLHVDSDERLKVLVQQERRLEVTMMHGQYGKCCCSPGPSPQCSWSTAPKLLGNFSKMCEMNKHAYTEYLGQPRAGAIEDRMLDQCGQAPDWLQFSTNQIVNACDKYSNKLNRDMEKLHSYFH